MSDCNPHPHTLIVEERFAIRNNVSLLRHLSDAAHTIGNPILGDRLDKIAQSLSTSEAVIGSAVGQWISQDVQRADEASNNMIRAVLATATVIR